MSLGRALLCALRALRRAPITNIYAIAAMTSALSVAGLGPLILVNLSRMTAHWGAGVHLVIYLRHDVESPQVQALAAKLRARPEVASVRLVSPREARSRLATALGDQARLVEGLEADFLPASLEVRLGGPPAAVGPLVALLETLPEVDEVDQLGGWARRLGHLATLARAAMFVTSLLLGLACCCVIVVTSRLASLPRAQESETIELLEATTGFAVAPFLLTGCLRGAISAVCAALLLLLAFSLAVRVVADGTACSLIASELRFLSIGQLAVGVLAAASTALLGSQLALSSRAP